MKKWKRGYFQADITKYRVVNTSSSVDLID